MKRLSLAVLAIGMLVGASSVTPAVAAQSRLSEVIFGKAYNDGVTAIRITHFSRRDQQLPLSVMYPMASTIRAARAMVSNDRHLLQAIADRGIALHNVVEVQTALNGGHVIYYR
jgi:hypothetical protein